MKVKLPLILSLMLYAGCSQSEPDKEPISNTVGKYLYVDSEDCIHIRRRCSALHSDFKALYRIDFVDTLYLSDDDFVWYCSRCIDEKSYEKINDIITRNKNKKWRTGNEHR